MVEFNLQIDGLVQERPNSIANTLELRLFCTNPSKSKMCDSESLSPSLSLRDQI